MMTHAISLLAPPTVSVRDLAFLDADHQQLTALLSHRLQKCQSTVIFTPNAKIGADAQRDPHLHNLLCQADLLLPDGAGVLLASHRCASRPLRHRLPGIEAGESVLQLAAACGYPVYFLGGQDGMAAAAARQMQQKFPDLIVAGCHHGYFDTAGQPNDRILQHIAASEAQIVLVCLGFPAQEKWILRSRSALPSVRLFIGLGGSFDVWAGKLCRAPAFFRAVHMEWLWRMLREPRRLKQLPAMLHYVFGK
jgi:N-acetylglucosaminyldiphosphoundecaprenol N-acetyl-beta-D-mannosaminyltransferase